MTDLLVRGGTVVTAAGSSRADVAVDGGRITAVEADLGGLAAGADEVVDATGLLVLPGGRRRPHPHAGRVRRGAGPVLPGLRRGRVRGHHDVPLVQQPRDRVVAGGRPIAAHGAARVARGDVERFGRRHRAERGGVGVPRGPGGRPAAPRRRRASPRSRRSWSTTSASTTPRCSGLLGAASAAGGMLEVHCENRTILDALTARHLAAGETGPRVSRVVAAAVCRGRGDRPGDRARPRRRRAAVRRPPLVRRGAGAGARSPCGGPARVRRDLPALPHAHRRPLRAAARGGREVRDLAAAPGRRQPRGAVGRASRTGRSRWSPPTTSPTGSRWRSRAGASRSTGSRTAGPGIETLLAMAWDGGVAAGRISAERLVDVLSTTPARLFGLRRKGAIEVGRDADLVLFDPAARRTMRAADLHHTSDYTPYEGREVRGAVRSTLVRGAFVVRDGAFVGTRGHGRFVERASSRWRDAVSRGGRRPRASGTPESRR